MTFVEIETVADIVYYPRLDFLDERIELKIRSGSMDLKRCEEVKSPVRKVKMAGIYVSQAEVEGCRCERWCGKANVRCD